MIQSELQMLAASFLFGIGIIISYELTDLFRMFFLLGKVARVISELVYWTIAAVLAFQIQFHLNDGVVRMYSVLGAALGLWIMYRFTGKLFDHLSVKVGRMARKRRKRRKKRYETMQNQLKKRCEQVKIKLRSYKEQCEETEKES